MADRARFAVSNIAWEPAEDDAMATMLRRNGVAGIEIAPTKWRDRPLEASRREVAEYRRTWEDRGLRVVSLQALLFGRPELQLFGPTRSEMADVLRATIDLGAALGAHALVFGSPKNRVRGTLPLADATRIAIEFFRELGAHAASCGVSLCIEANPAAYGCDFITTTTEAVALCAAVDSPGIGVNGDLGGMTISHENLAEVMNLSADVLRHFHVSEPHLAELGAESDHVAAAAALDAIGYDAWVSIEMKAATGSNVARVERAVRLAKPTYVFDANRNAEGDANGRSNSDK